MYKDDDAWLNCDVENLWTFDKLILSKKLGYACGPIGVDVPYPGNYIVRPCVNVLGMGIGAQFAWIEKGTNHLPTGHFWCEIFTGRHLTVDYTDGKQIACVEGFRTPNEPLYKWDRWERVDDVIPYPSILKIFSHVNCEFIGGNLIEVHLRHNPDSRYGAEVLIPVWQGENTTPPKGMKYIEDPDYKRLGFFIKK